MTFHASRTMASSQNQPKGRDRIIEAPSRCMQNEDIL